MADQRVDTCKFCRQPIYLNTHPRRTIRVWAHRATGSKYCGLDETTTAQP